MPSAWEQNAHELDSNRDILYDVGNCHIHVRCINHFSDVLFHAVKMLGMISPSFQPAACMLWLGNCGMKGGSRHNAVDYGQTTVSLTPLFLTAEYKMNSLSGQDNQVALG